MSTTLCLNNQGIAIRITSDDEEILSWIAFDFSAFLVPCCERPRIDFIVHRQAPPFDELPPMDEVMRTSSFVCFQKDDMRYVSYQRTVLVAYDYSLRRAHVYGADSAALYEKLYTIIISRLGEELDRMGLHRLHALGVSIGGRATLLMFPSGGGKSTTALSLLKHTSAMLLSEDSPLIDRKGMVHPFPFRLGITNGEGADEIPAAFLRQAPNGLRRKTLVNVAYFADKLERIPVKAGTLLIGKWTTAPEPRAEPAGLWMTWKTLVRDGVFGLGLPQLIEYFLTARVRDVAAKGMIGASRLYAVTRLLFGTRKYVVYLAADREKNLELIDNLLRG